MKRHCNSVRRNHGNLTHILSIVPLQLTRQKQQQHNNTTTQQQQQQLSCFIENNFHKIPKLELNHINYSIKWIHQLVA